MDELTRRKLEMGKRVLDFCRAHPDSNPDFMAMVSRLEASLARAGQLAMPEQQSLGKVRPSTKGKRKLRRTMRRSDSDGKVLPLRQESNDEPTDPAA
jgi:hypothetical protein